MKLEGNKLTPEEGLWLKDINDHGQKTEDGPYIPPYLTKVVYVGRQITTLEQAQEIYEEVEKKLYEPEVNEDAGS